MKDESASFGKVMQFWPLIVAIGIGTAGYFKLSFTVDQLASQAEQRSRTIDEQRERRTQEMEAIRTRLTKLEDWRELQSVRH